MFTKEQLLHIIPEVPDEFSIEDLAAILSRPRSEPPVTATPPRPADLTPEELADWDYYTSPEALALYAKVPLPPEVAALRGIATSLSPDDLKKSAKEWEAARIRAKYGV